MNVRTGKPPIRPGAKRHLADAVKDAEGGRRRIAFRDGVGLGQGAVREGGATCQRQKRFHPRCAIIGR
jgi:hypothetical protein